MKSKKSESEFWKIAESMYSDPSVKEGTMMGFKCLRVNKAFFATLNHRTSELVVKLPKNRVTELIEDKAGSPFKPAGRVFKEWITLSQEQQKNWKKFMMESKKFVMDCSK